MGTRTRDAGRGRSSDPLFNAAITFVEPFPVGLLVTLISAGVLRRKNTAPAAGWSLHAPQVGLGH